MAAKKKSASRRSTTKAKAKKAKPRPKVKKAAKKKVAARPKKPAAKKAARKAAPRRAPSSGALLEIDRRIALVRNNLRDLTEQAAAASGGANEDLSSDRIASQEAELKRLYQERDALAKG
jgi:hypothetical protein